MKVANTWDGIVELQIGDLSHEFVHSYQVTIPDLLDSKSSILDRHDPNEILDSVLRNCPLDKSRIVGLRVQNLPITEIPESITQFQTLKKLALIRNKLADFPKEVSELRGLEDITISNSTIRSIPEEIVELQKLRHLNICNSNIPELPTYLMELQNLEYLGISGADLQLMPPEIKRLKNLKKLDLYKNQLSTFPEGIAELPNLEVLWLHANAFTSSENSQIKEMLPYVDVILGKPVDKG